MSLHNKWHRLPLASVAALLMLAPAGHAAPQLRGFNFLQDQQIALDSPRACHSLRNLLQTGANSVAFIPFLKQENASGSELSMADNVTDRQLKAGIRTARQLGLQVIVKPQLLVENGWAGQVEPASDEEEQAWFDRYTDHLIHYARLAEANHAAAMVIGTELKQLGKSRHWPQLIRAIRCHFSGRLSYAAHGVAGISEFRYWDLLDAIGVTLYPAFPKNASPEQIRTVIDELVDNLQSLTEKQADRPVWVLEIGSPSARGWEQHPWDWQKLREQQPAVDTGMQAVIMKEWLASLDRPWIEGVWVWKWRSSPQAGGKSDSGYTVQNKPAQSIIQEAWQCPVSATSPRGNN